jgi:hypothetical protein
MIQANTVEFETAANLLREYIDGQQEQLNSIIHTAFTDIITLAFSNHDRNAELSQQLNQVQHTIHCHRVLCNIV